MALCQAVFGNYFPSSNCSLAMFWLPYPQRSPDHSFSCLPVQLTALLITYNIYFLQPQCITLKFQELCMQYCMDLLMIKRVPTNYDMGTVLVCTVVNTTVCMYVRSIKAEQHAYVCTRTRYTYSMLYKLRQLKKHRYLISIFGVSASRDAVAQCSMLGHETTLPS
jgi:hypothetical protein